MKIIAMIIAITNIDIISIFTINCPFLVKILVMFFKLVRSTVCHTCRSAGACTAAAFLKVTLKFSVTQNLCDVCYCSCLYRSL